MGRKEVIIWNKPRVAAYARVSSKEQTEKELSIPAQLKALHMIFPVTL